MIQNFHINIFPLFLARVLINQKYEFLVFILVKKTSKISISQMSLNISVTCV